MVGKIVNFRPWCVCVCACTSIGVCVWVCVCVRVGVSESAQTLPLSPPQCNPGPLSSWSCVGEGSLSPSPPPSSAPHSQMRGGEGV